MSAAPQIQHPQPSAFFERLLSAAFNASTETFDEDVQALKDYVGALESERNITAWQADIRVAMAAKENERKALRKQIAKLPRFDEHEGAMVTAEFGDWLSFYDVMSILR